MNAIIDFIKQHTGTTSDALAITIFVVAIFIAIFAVVGIVISIMLWWKYHVLNKTKNSCGMTGEQVARKILDDNGLGHIKVKATGSFLWGNSYSHYFKKVRLRRFTYKKDTVTSLAMAAQKSSLAIMDKENDPIMRTRNILIPLQIFGPMMFVPLVLLGLVIDIGMWVLNGGAGNVNFLWTFILAGLGLFFYVVSFVLTVVILKAETKAQAKSIEILRQENLANEQEIEQIRGLYKMYNLEYINNMILAFLELLMRILQIVAAAQGNFARNNNNN